MVQVHSLRDLFKSGWKLLTRTPSVSSVRSTVLFAGRTNLGKTFITGQLANKRLPSGHAVHTRGINVVYAYLDGHGNPPVAVIDPQGTLQVDFGRKREGLVSMTPPGVAVGGV